MVDHDYAISTDNQKVQLPTFYPDMSHYLYHQPDQVNTLYGNGAAQIRDMQFSGSSAPQNLRGLDFTPAMFRPPPKQPLLSDRQQPISPTQSPNAETPLNLANKNTISKPRNHPIPVKEEETTPPPCTNCKTRKIGLSVALLLTILAFIGIVLIF